MLKNKKLLIIISLLAVIIIVGIFLLMNVFAKPNLDYVNNTNITVDTPEKAEIMREKDSNRKIETADTTIDDKQIYDDTPMLKDFSQGTFNYRYDFKDANKYDLFMWVALENNSNRLNYSYVAGSEGITFPRIATGITTLVLNNQQLENVNKGLSSMSQERVVKEGDWTFAILSYRGYGENLNVYDYYAYDGPWCGIDLLSNLDRNKKSLFAEDLERGFGWPSDWLKKEPYKTNLYNSFKINMDDPLWDKYNVQQTIKYHNDKNKYSATIVDQNIIKITKIDQNNQENKFDLKMNDFENFISMNELKDGWVED